MIEQLMKRLGYVPKRELDDALSYNNWLLEKYKERGNELSFARARLDRLMLYKRVQDVAQRITEGRARF